MLQTKKNKSSQKEKVQNKIQPEKSKYILMEQRFNFVCKIGFSDSLKLHFVLFASLLTRKRITEKYCFMV